MFNILLILSLVLFSTPTLAQGPFADSPPTEYNAQINPTDPNWQFKEEDSAVFRQAQNNQGIDLNLWWLLVPVLLLPIFYLATRYFSYGSNLDEKRNISPSVRSAISYHDIRVSRRKRDLKKKAVKGKEEKYDKAFAP